LFYGVVLLTASAMFFKFEDRKRALIGIDIVSFDIPQGGETVAEFIWFFSSYFSTFEWDNNVNADTSDDVLIEFYKYVHSA
jgi:hypothetical protein